MTYAQGWKTQPDAQAVCGKYLLSWYWQTGSPVCTIESFMKVTAPQTV